MTTVRLPRLWFWGREIMNHKLVAGGHHVCRLLRKSIFIVNCSQLHLEWVQRCRNLTEPHSQHGGFEEEFLQQVCAVDAWIRVCWSSGECFWEDCPALWVQAGGESSRIGVGKFTVVKHHPYHILAHTWILCGTKTFCRIHYCQVLGNISRINPIIKKIILCLIVWW